MSRRNGNAWCSLLGTVAKKNHNNIMFLDLEVAKTPMQEIRLLVCLTFLIYEEWGSVGDQSVHSTGWDFYSTSITHLDLSKESSVTRCFGQRSSWRLLCELLQMCKCEITSDMDLDLCYDPLLGFPNNTFGSLRCDWRAWILRNSHRGKLMVYYSPGTEWGLSNNETMGTQYTL